MHKKKKVENLLEEKLFFERRIWTLKGWKEYCSIDDSLRNTFCMYSRTFLCSVAIMHFYLQIKKDKALCCSVGVSYSSTSHVSKGLSNLTWKDPNPMEEEGGITRSFLPLPLFVFFLYILLFWCYYHVPLHFTLHILQNWFSIRPCLPCARARARANMRGASACLFVADEQSTKHARAPSTW